MVDSKGIFLQSFLFLVALTISYDFLNLKKKKSRLKLERGLSNTFWLYTISLMAFDFMNWIMLG